MLASLHQAQTLIRILKRKSCDASAERLDDLIDFNFNFKADGDKKRPPSDGRLPEEQELGWLNRSVDGGGYAWGHWWHVDHRLDGRRRLRARSGLIRASIGHEKGGSGHGLG